MNQSDTHRQRIKDIFSNEAAQKTYSALNNDIRPLVTATEMQAGK